MPLWPRFPAWDRWVSRRHALMLKRAVAGRGDDSRPIALLFHPIYQPWLEWLEPRYVAYHIFDSYHMMENWEVFGAPLERALLERADLITTSSSGILENLPWGGSDKGRVLNNGADAAAFVKGVGAPCPADLAAIPRPRIGYVGAINAKVDMETILTVSERRPDWHWVFIGPTYMNGNDAMVKQARERWQRLLERGNVHHFGRKPGSEMPAYVNNMDILAICYKIARTDAGEKASWVVHGYPTKLHEFLATGKPVVAGSQQVIVDEFSHVVRLADDADAWQEAIIEGLERGGVGTPDLRRKVAMANTWESRVDLLEGWLEEMVAAARP